MIRLSLLIRITKTALLIMLMMGGVPIAADTGPMDGSMDTFYIQHRHPVIKEGDNFIGNIILKNNNPDGFSVILTSQNGGKMVPVSQYDSEVNIDYELKFEALSGRIGSGVISDFIQTTMLAPHVLFTSSDPIDSTDLATKVILNITNFNEHLMMAGTYKDMISVDYINN